MTPPDTPSIGEGEKLDRSPGHCSDDNIWAEFAARYGPLQRVDLALGDETDFAVANAVYLANRHDPDLTAMQTAAKDRIRWLSVQLHASRKESERYRAALEKWRCPTCLGGGKVIAPGRVAQAEQCKTCDGHGLHPLARAALDSSNG